MKYGSSNKIKPKNEQEQEQEKGKHQKNVEPFRELIRRNVDDAKETMTYNITKRTEETRGSEEGEQENHKFINILIVFFSPLFRATICHMFIICLNTFDEIVTKEVSNKAFHFLIVKIFRRRTYRKFP